MASALVCAVAVTPDKSIHEGGGGHTHTLQYGGSRRRNTAPLPRPPKLVPVTSERLDLQDRTKSPPSLIHPRGPRLLSVSYRTHQRWQQWLRRWEAVLRSCSLASQGLGGKSGENATARVADIACGLKCTHKTLYIVQAVRCILMTPTTTTTTTKEDMRRTTWARI